MQLLYIIAGVEINYIVPVVVLTWRGEVVVFAWRRVLAVLTGRRVVVVVVRFFLLRSTVNKQYGSIDFIHRHLKSWVEDYWNGQLYVI